MAPKGHPRQHPLSLTRIVSETTEKTDHEIGKEAQKSTERANEFIYPYALITDQTMKRWKIFVVEIANLDR